MERVMALDPNAGGLRASDRYHRSLEILNGVLQAEQSCLAANNDPEVNSTRKVLAHHPRPGEIDDATELNLDIAVRMWKSGRNLCPSKGQESEELDLVLMRLSRQ